MHRRHFFSAMVALAAMPQITNALEPRMNSIFRSDNPTDILNGYVQLLRDPRAPRQQNEAMAALAVRDPVALWIAVATVIPEPSDPAARAEQMTALAEGLWGPVVASDKDSIRALCLAAAENPLDGNAAAVTLAESQDVWFTAGGLVDQIEAISANSRLRRWAMISAHGRTGASPSRRSRWPWGIRGAASSYPRVARRMPRC